MGNFRWRKSAAEDGSAGLRPMCPQHNLLLAELALGRAYVRRRIRFRQRKQKNETKPGDC